MSKFKDILKACLANVTAENTTADVADVEVPVADSVSNADTLKVEVIPVSAVAQDSPSPSIDDLPTYTATPAKIEQWHNQIKSDLEIGIFFYNARRDFGEKLFPTFKSLIQGAEFEKFKIGYDRYSGSYIFVIDSNRYIKAQTFLVNDETYKKFLNSDDALEIELNYKTPAADKVLKLINSLRAVPAQN